MTSPSPPILSTHPLKTLYTLTLLLTLPLRLLFILTYYIPRPLRQNPRWTYHQATGLALFRIWWNYTSTIQYHTSKSLLPGRLKDRFIVIPPSSSLPTIYQGITDDPVVRPVTIGAVWYPQPYDPHAPPSQLVTLHFHGGAYILGGCRPLESGWGPLILSQHTKGPILQVQYRLSVEKDSYFPAALQDALTAYTHLLHTLQIPPKNILLSGESAGAHLVLSLLRHLTHSVPRTLPLPRAALLWSPWVNLLPNQTTLDTHPSARSDYMSGSLLEWGARSFTPPGGDRGGPYISPLLHPFKSPVPLFVQTGTQEVLYGDHVRFVEGMRGVGTRVEFVEIRDAPHDTFGAGLILGWAREAEDAAGRAAGFIEGLVGDGGEVVEEL